MKQSHEGTHKTVKLRHLRAIEIAEGALLADIAVVFQLIVHYVPLVGIFFTLLVPPLFTILVLRRGLYTALMGMCVALFTISLIVGLTQVQIMILEIGAGIFLGVTMKYRLHYIPLILLGVTVSAIGITSITLLSILLLGPTFLTVMLDGLRQSYNSAFRLLDFLTPQLGLATAWHANAPTIKQLAALSLNYWLVVIFVSDWLILIPVVMVVYYITAFLVRLMGYDVRPFPDGVLNRIIQWLIRFLINIALKLGLGKYWATRLLIKEMRRQSMGLRRNGVATLSGGEGIICRPPIYGGAHSQAKRESEARNDTVTALPLIDIQHITYAYPVQKVGNSTAQRVTALQNVSLQVAEGEYLALLGHNGSGKSTLARHCNALLIPDEGHVTVAGYLTSDEANWRTIRDTVGMIFQNPDNQIIATVVEDDVAWALAVRGYPAQLIQERVTNAMAAVGITHLRKLPPHQLSGGQRQRVAIAGVLALQPRCIIADEATAQLDPLSRREIVALLHQLNRTLGLTIIHVTHLLEEIVEADRIVIMEQGQIVMEGAPSVILSRPLALSEANGEESHLHALKLTIPEPIALAARLREEGLPIASEALTTEAIAREIMS